jgi:hypothetical protein
MLSEEIMNDFVLLYKAYAQYKQDGGNRTMNDSLVDMITPIAVKHPALQSPAAVSARAILWHERNLIFSDSDYTEPYISGYISDSCEQQYLNVNVPFWMEDENYQNTDTLAYTDSTGHFYISTEQLQQLNNTVNYRLVFSIDGTTMRYSAYRSIAEHIIKSDYYFSCNTFGKKSNNLANNTSEITTHPNPAGEQFTIQTDEIVKEVKLFNVLGQEVYKGDNKEVSTAYLPYGVYVLHVVTNKNTYVQRILKK